MCCVLVILPVLQQLDGLWSALAGIGTFVLAGVALFAYFTAKGQLAAAVEARNDAARISKAEATTVLLKEFGEDEMEYLFGFFDVAYDIEDSRDVCINLYRQFIVAERGRKRAIGSREDRLDVLKAEMLEAVDDDLEDGDAPITDADRANEIKNKVIEVANRCERAWVLIEQKAVDAEFFLSDQAYNVASSYFILEDVLVDLCKEERFNFDDFRNIAILARDFIKKSHKFDPRLANAEFGPLPEYEPTPRSALP